MRKLIVRMTAVAAWTAAGTGSAGAAAVTMPNGNPPSAGASGSSVTVTWTAAKFATGAAVAGYTVQRFDAVNGAQATVGAGCSGVVTTTTCTELGVPAGTWTYTDTPVQDSWTGAASPASNPVTVGSPLAVTAPAKPRKIAWSAR